MQASIIIPLWNGADVIADCLDAVYAHANDRLGEVICVDNASPDGAADLVADRYPQVRLLHQPVNLGFAGGVNVGLEAAQGDVFVLLNQDCLVQPGWLVALHRALEEHPQVGIVGCTILNADGTVNHAGARIHYPDAFGLHLTEVGNGLQETDFVTGAAVAIRRQTWDAVGRFDEGFYPAYYEDADYCYRARRHGFRIAYVPDARVTHLFSGREWQADPLKHTANQHTARYRFVSKHFDGPEITAFFKAEGAAVAKERYFDQVAGRALAARDTLRHLPDILERRRADLGDRLAPAWRRQLQVGFTGVWRRSLDIAEKLIMVGLEEPPLDEWQASNAHLLEALDLPSMAEPSPSPELEYAIRQLELLEQREQDLLTRLYFRSPADDRPERRLRRWFRLLARRPLSFLAGRDHLLLMELTAVHAARLDQMNQIYRTRLDQFTIKIAQLHQLYGDRTKQNRLLFDYHRERLERRLKLLEALTDYDYR